MFLLAAISLGFLGSFHCIGMCGPIAFSIPVKRTSSTSVLAGSLIYNSGRIITYTIIGFLFGLLGQGIALAGWQNALSITLGVLILFILFLPNAIPLRYNAGLFFGLIEKIKSQLRKLFSIHTSSSLLLIGILNGLLPCGLVYLGVAGAIATGSAINGALFMAVFGIGTFPAMISLTVIRDYISLRIRERIRRTIPIFVGIMGILLILRGMNLGIPYISPTVETSTSGICHHNCCAK
jgi:sulfite exporter TauE/SafE